MKRLLSYMKPYKKESIIAPLFKMLEALFELIIPLIVASMIDLGIKEHDTVYIFRMGGLMILLGILGFLCSLIAQYFAAKAAVFSCKGIRSDLFKHIHSLSYNEIDSIGTSTLITRMTSDVNQVQNGVNWFLRLFMRSPFIVIGALIMALVVDAKMGLIFVVIIPILAIIVSVILFGTRPLYNKVQKRLDQVVLKTRENLSGVRVIRAFHKEDEEMQTFNESSGELYKSQMFVARFSSVLNPATYVVINLGICAILWFGGKMTNSGNLSQGQIIALINYLSQILIELIKLANLIILLSKSSASLGRVNQIFAIQSSMKDGKADWPQGHSITFKNVSYAYPNAKEPSLSNISFSIKEGETIGIIGGTGSGKSTLVNLIPRFYDPTVGTITVMDQLLSDVKTSDIRKRVAIVPQKATLIKGSIRKNMTLGGIQASDQDIMKALSIAQALPFVSEKEEGLDFEIEQEGRNLSGGQKQRLTIARALTRKPEILILDDSSSALDFSTDKKLRESISSLDASMTIFLVSQRIATVRSADRIIVLDEGHMVDMGRHEELLARCSLYCEIYQSQTGKEAHE